MWFCNRSAYVVVAVAVRPAGLRRVMLRGPKTGPTNMTPSVIKPARTRVQFITHAMRGDKTRFGSFTEPSVVYVIFSQ
eukprot:COSAG05_NODE_933_length_6538_cov_16.519646_10_plen_78_part_00